MLIQMLNPKKGGFLSIIMSTFDPLGYLTHFTVSGKLLLRELWRSNCLWDEPIPAGLISDWERWREQIKNIAKFRIPAFIFH